MEIRKYLTRMMVKYGKYIIPTWDEWPVHEDPGYILTRYDSNGNVIEERHVKPSIEDKLER